MEVLSLLQTFLQSVITIHIWKTKPVGTFCLARNMRGSILQRIISMTKLIFLDLMTQTCAVRQSDKTLQGFQPHLQ